MKKPIMLPTLQKLLDDVSKDLREVEKNSTAWQLMKYRHNVVLRCGCKASVPYEFSKVCDLVDTPCPNCKTLLTLTAVLGTAYHLLQNAEVDLEEFDPPEV